MWIERMTKRLMLFVGIVGVLVIYFGFFYLLFKPQASGTLPWYILLSPWLCIYFGLSVDKQRKSIDWLMQKLMFKR
ncbi:hypothetical protein [Shewanella psychrotolerans]|uniref:hypothetical protein n=1 Tax=Shewanella psychrotolerans TaxID=2864206 RepID=UPI001C65BD5D|nr:hypothetical protein [Shewanella psychrotolerans]QYK02921.1 hypothetical protein K0I62_08300 [Shewanella psychrotolerans]